MPTISHVLLTRFNLPTAGVESIVRAKEGWLRQRQAIFETYCLPSIRGQTKKEFRWLIYFDPESPEWLRDRIDRLHSTAPFTPVFREAVSPSELASDIAEVADPEADVLLTTNLDNDDGLALDFVERLQQSVTDTGEIALYFSRGLIVFNRRLYLRTDPLNAFCSVASPMPSPRTCWHDWHTLLPKHMPSRQISGAPGWLQVIHGTNVSNRVRGRRIGPLPYRRQFESALNEIPDVGALHMALERLALEPARALREVGRKVTKEVLLQVGGKTAIDRVKVAVSRSAYKPASEARNVDS